MEESLLDQSVTLVVFFFSFSRVGSIVFEEMLTIY